MGTNLLHVTAHGKGADEQVEREKNSVYLTQDKCTARVILTELFL